MSKDIYRDTPVRYLGYANEVGELFRDFIGYKSVLAINGLKTTYILADTFDKTTNCYYRTNANHPSSDRKSIFTAVDTLTWQMLASVMIPGFAMNRIRALTYYVLRRTGPLPCTPINMRRALVSAVVLGAIPLISGPIDKFTDQILDNTLRKFKP